MNVRRSWMMAWNQASVNSDCERSNEPLLK